MSTCNLQVTNNYELDAHFHITIISKDEEDIIDEIQRETRRIKRIEKIRAANVKRKLQNRPLLELEYKPEPKENKNRYDKNRKLIKRFKYDEFLYRMSKDEVFVRAGESVIIKINFLPMSLGKHECCVILCDE